MTSRVHARLIVVGGGGHAKVVISSLIALGRTVIGFVDPDDRSSAILGIPRIGGDEEVFKHPPGSIGLINGVGSVAVGEQRRRLYESYRSRGYQFENLVHPSAIVAADAMFGEGIQVMAGSILQPGVTVGANAIVNTRASIDHDCVLGAHVHIAPGVTLSGNVRVGDGAHIGTGACVIQGVTIGEMSLIGAGAVVIDDVPPATTVVGVPARSISRVVILA